MLPRPVQRVLLILGAILACVPLALVVVVASRERSPQDLSKVTAKILRTPRDERDRFALGAVRLGITDECVQGCVELRVRRADESTLKEQ